MRRSCGPTARPRRSAHRASRWADVLPASERARLYESRSYECYLTNQFADASAARQQALAIWREAGGTIKVGESHRGLSRLAWFLGVNDAAEHCAPATTTPA